jgi:hypothetical protein
MYNMDLKIESEEKDIDTLMAEFKNALDELPNE